MAIPKRIEDKAVSTLIALALSLRLLNAGHFLLKMKRGRHRNHCAPAVYDWSSKCNPKRAMLRIEKDTDGCVSRLKLSGRIQSDCIARIRSAMNDGSARKILDLGEITLVDIAVVRFLISCENEGVELVRCPHYVREWMLRERAEEEQPGSSSAT